MTSLFESPDEIGDAERLRDAINYARHLAERVHHRLTLQNLRLAERYIKGELKIHIHFRSMASLETTDYCVVLYRAVGSPSEPKEMGPIGRNFAGSRHMARHVPREHGHIQPENGVGGSIGREKSVVLVYDVRDVQAPQKLVSTFVGFDRLENVHRAFTPALYRSSMGVFKFLGSIIEGELGFATGSGSHGNAPQNIEGGAEVMDGISGNGSQSEGGCLPNPNVDIECPGFLVFLGDKQIGVGSVEGGDRDCEITEVLFGPFDLDPTAGRPIGHG